MFYKVKKHFSFYKTEKATKARTEDPIAQFWPSWPHGIHMREYVVYHSSEGCFLLSTTICS